MVARPAPASERASHAKPGTPTGPPKARVDQAPVAQTIRQVQAVGPPGTPAPKGTAAQISRRSGPERGKHHALPQSSGATAPNEPCPRRPANNAERSPAYAPRRRRPRPNRGQASRSLHSIPPAADVLQQLTGPQGAPGLEFDSSTSPQQDKSIKKGPMPSRASRCDGHLARRPSHAP
ncbi:hypothetical protein NDU88_003830 [Pleurodeles waltl]|uniref:Uncharacterized protein n=1 Tax=Pleurodeles waltl TaxID=8319 RepID=A0AAV7SH19_PLEWA|nr:hypothetical protein NDU88_003830 [Pleurodeles waltl]